MRKDATKVAQIAMNYFDVKQKLQDYRHFILGAQKALHAAVLIPLIEKDGALHLVFELRAQSLRSQPGDISFPGGKIDPEDASPLEAALRELQEELGLAQNQVDVLTELDLFVSPYGIIIHNFLGKINDLSQIHLNTDEVSELLIVPLQFFRDQTPISFQGEFSMDRTDFPFHLIPQGSEYAFKSARSETLFWKYGEHTIWGFTASIVQNLISLLYD